MKVTVCFEDVRVVVPCGSGQRHVRELVEDAIARYYKVLAKPSDGGWLNASSVRLLTSDGGILDPDDCVSDVVDDREQLKAVYDDYVDDEKEEKETHESLGQRHHNDGDGTSTSSVGTSSPDSFREPPQSSAAGPPGTVKQRDSQSCSASSAAAAAAAAAAETRHPADCYSVAVSDKGVVGDDVIAMSRNRDSTTESQTAAASERASCSGTRRGTSSDAGSDSSLVADCTVVSALEQLRLQRNKQQILQLQQPAATAASHVTSANAVAGSRDVASRQEPLGGSSVTKVSENQTCVSHENHRKSLPSSAVGPMMASNIRGQSMSVGFVKMEEPLGIHVVPEFDKHGRNIGLTIQSFEVDGRAHRDGRLRCGDRVTEINGTSLFEKEFDEAQDIFRSALQTSNLEMTVVRCEQPAVIRNNHTPSASVVSTATQSSEDGNLSSSGSWTKKKKVPTATLR